jgi:hypothetical protein
MMTLRRGSIVTGDFHRSGVFPSAAFTGASIDRPRLEC